MRMTFFVAMMLIEILALIVNLVTAPIYVRAGKSSKPIASIGLSLIMLVGTIVLYGGQP